jgi:transcriptional regulator of arginine metabolism
MSKRYRQGQILKLIQMQQVHTQDEIAEELAKRGVPATQVTLSRDLRELGLVKTPSGYRALSREEPEGDTAGVVAEYVIDMRCAQNLIVLKTDPGHASLVASALDHTGWADVAGTIAGDDTVLVITPDQTAAEQLRVRLLQMMSQ